MGNHPRVESAKLSSFITSRSRNSELWFINNPALEQAILGFYAHYASKHEVKLYGIAIEGSHIHNPAAFPHENRASFMRDVNSQIARAVPRYTPEYPGGRLFERSYGQEFLPAPDDIEEYFFYTALQPINDGLVEKISDFPGYHFFHDAVWGIPRTFEVIQWKEYNAAKKRNKAVRRQDYTIKAVLRYERLPGYEHLSQREYALLMMKKFEERRLVIVANRRAAGLGFLGPEKLKAIPRGTPALNPKRSNRNSHRPRILSVCPERRAHYKAWYFEIYFAYKEASRRYRSGEFSIQFPPGTYKPPVMHRGPPLPILLN